VWEKIKNFGTEMLRKGKAEFFKHWGLILAFALYTLLLAGIGAGIMCRVSDRAREQSLRTDLQYKADILKLSGSLDEARSESICTQIALDKADARLGEVRDFISRSRELNTAIANSDKSGLELLDQCIELNKYVTTGLAGIAGGR
jgi:hypothetical protein